MDPAREQVLYKTGAVTEGQTGLDNRPGWNAGIDGCVTEAKWYLQS